MILVKNRQMLFSNRENYLGTAYDNNSNKLEFLLDRVNEDGLDMAQLSFTLNLAYSDTDTTDSLVFDMDTTERQVKLTTELSQTVMSHVGTHLMQLVGYEVSGTYKWSTFRDVVYIEDALAVTPSEATLTALEQLEAKVNEAIAKNEAAEAKRKEAEEARVSAEEEREAAEEARASAETERADAETARENAESKRVTKMQELVEGYDAASLLAQSYAIGGTGTREGEDTDNAKYYKEQAQATKQGALHVDADNSLYFGDKSSAASEGEEVTGVVAQDEATKTHKLHKFKDAKARNAAEANASAISTLASTLSTEIERAQGAEQAIATAIGNETSRAKSAEQANASAISTISSNLSAEIERAQGADEANATAISDEATRATEAEALKANKTELMSLLFTVVSVIDDDATS